MTDRVPVPAPANHDASVLPPFEELTLRDGRLFHIGPGSLMVEVFETPPVDIAAKSDVVDLPGDDAAFLFRLNHVADHVWAHYFASHVGEVHAEIQGAQLEIRCPPEDLMRNYAAVKSAVARTNETYAQQRARICDQVVEHEAKRAQHATAAARKARAAQAAWEHLDL